jgi:two-component system response regulator HydG
MDRILLVDDDLQALESTKKILEFSGYTVVTAVDGQSALEQVRPTILSAAERSCSAFNLVITDVRMPRLGGLEFLRALSLCGETLPVILMTAFGRVEDAVWAMKLGAVDFLTKPFKRQALLSSVEAALKRARAQTDLKETALSPLSSALIGRSEAMVNLRSLIAKVAHTHASVLLTGESGTGKERVARCLHRESSRAQSQFIALNCAAVPEQLIESELFGFEKGAFSGATATKIGLFEAAHEGTLLLDEVGDMPIVLQAKLLRILQEGEVRRLGSTTSKKIDVRVIASTHKNLPQAVQEGRFRQDLLYRLEIVAMHVPPLRERLDDIGDLSDYFLKKAAQRHGKSPVSLSEETLKVLKGHTWPGNVRELSNVLERAIIFAAGPEIKVNDLPSHLHAAAAFRSVLMSTIAVPLGTPLKEVEELLIRKTLEATDGDKNMTAKLLGINSRTIYRKLDKKVDKDAAELE